MRTDPDKVRAVAEWPKPTSDLWQKFYFMNCCRFIRDYSWMATPLTQLPLPGLLFFWTTEAEDAFMELKRCFTSATIMVKPDPSKQFIAEVDTPTLALDQSSPRVLRLTRSCTLVPFSPDALWQLNTTMI